MERKGEREKKDKKQKWVACVGFSRLFLKNYRLGKRVSCVVLLSHPFDDFNNCDEPDVTLGSS